MGEKRRGFCAPSLRALTCSTVVLVLGLGLPSSAASRCKRKPVIFNFGDPNSDAGAATLPRFRPFSLDVQVRQFLLFRLRSPLLLSRGRANLVGEDGFTDALYIIGIGRNDLATQLATLPYSQAVGNISGFEHPLMARCGDGGPPYNHGPNIACGRIGFAVCDEAPRRVTWDGVRFTEAANSFVASRVLSSSCSTPPVAFDFFCNV